MPPPPKNALSESQIELLKTWIDQGAKAPADELPADPRNHWAFQAAGPSWRAAGQEHAWWSAIPSTASSFAGWKRKASRRRRRPTASR